MRAASWSAFAGVLLAAGSADAAGGMPQLDPSSFAPQLVWLAIAFIALYLVMDRLAVPAISDTLDRRQAKIQGDLDAAERANEETRALVAAYEKRLADAREEARRLMREQGEADSAVATERFNELAERLAREIEEAERRIAAQRDDVMAGLQSMAQDIGREVYGKLIGHPVDDAALGAKLAAATRGSGS